jgi:GGDEF domain-containing protein
VVIAGDAHSRIVLICADPGRRCLVERVATSAETHASPTEALLAVVRRPPRAVIVSLEDVQGTEHEVLAALLRVRPQMPVYTLVRPENEPLGASLVREGAADYFVCPGDLQRLSHTLQAHRPGPGRPVAAAAEPLGLFQAACALSELAMAPPHLVFRDGAALILRALGARRGCAFSCGAESRRLEIAATFGEAADPGRAGTGVERAPAELTLRTGDVLFVRDGAADAPPGGLLCVPVRQGGATYGVLCITGKTDGSPLGPQDRSATEALVAVLSRLYQAAMQRDEYARLALRDVETGLLTADPFLTYLETLISRAEDERAELGLLLLEPQRAGRSVDADLLGRLGRAVQACLAKGWQGGRLEAGLFAVSLPCGSDDGPPHDAWQAAAAHLEAAVRRVGPPLDLCIALAVFPRDGATAKALVAAARARLTTSV